MYKNIMAVCLTDVASLHFSRDVGEPPEDDRILAILVIDHDLVVVSRRHHPVVNTTTVAQTEEEMPCHDATVLPLIHELSENPNTAIEISSSS